MHAISHTITSIISQLGYFGIFFWMLLESACIPVPSEAIMPFAGAMIATRHEFNIHLLAFTGALGNLAGSILAYWVGRAKGREFVVKYGKYVLINAHDIDSADHWFTKHGDITVFFTRVLPIIRTFISLPAGISRMPFGRFCLYTFLGALPWCYFLAWVGVKLGQHWEVVSTYFHKADAAIAILCIVLLGLWIKRHLSATSKDSAATQANAVNPSSEIG